MILYFISLKNIFGYYLFIYTSLLFFYLKVLHYVTCIVCVCVCVYEKKSAYLCFLHNMFLSLSDIKVLP